MPLPLIDVGRLERLDLAPYSHVLLVDGDYAHFGKPVAEALGGWVRRGGILVASGRAAKWASEAVLEAKADRGSRAQRQATRSATVPAAASARAREPPGDRRGWAAGTAPTRARRRSRRWTVRQCSVSPPAPERRPYADFEADRQAQRITGAVFEVDLDLTHPLAFGYSETRLPVFRDSTQLLAPSANPYETVARYADHPLLAGYISDHNLAALAGTPALIATRLGKGAVIRFADDPNFRALWYGTQKLYLNALFFGKVIESTEIGEP